MKRVLYSGAFLLLVFGCSKDKFQTKPQITVETDGNVIIPVNSGFTVSLKYTDKEGDVDNLVFVKKERLNQRTTATIRDSFTLKVPEFPNTNEGQIIMNFDYQAHLVSAQVPPNIPGSVPPQKEPDTLNFKFVLKDKEGNASDTAVLNNVIIRRN